MATSNSIITMRRHDLDNLRSFLTGLVVVHHTSTSYGGPGQGTYLSALVATASPASTMPLLALNALDQSFFMGLFFWISGRVSAQSLQRADEASRTRWGFVRSKLLRLGLPSVVYTLALQPIELVAALPSWELAAVRRRLVEYYSTLNGIRGPVWYTANLLLLDVAAALMAPNQARRGASAKEPTPTTDGSAPEELPFWYDAARRWGWLGVAGASFLVRLRYPVGEVIESLWLQPAHAPQYVFAYAMGFASPGLETTFTGPCTPGHALPGRASGAGRRLVAAVLATLAAFPLIWLPRLFGPAGAATQGLGLASFFGGWNPYALLYAVWNELSFVLVGPALMAYFAEARSAPAQSALFQAKNSYGAFLMHMIVSVLVERALDRVLVSSPAAALIASAAWRSCGMVVMTVAAGALNVAGSFASARFLLDSFPILRRIV
ncbi:Acyltransferase 3 [Purpureocillium lavendulum]|uniref:Acyltransferase 3 n=1 Tax=Purpureocillium lavendulum TaxID=1247861 RepID=A0AB34FPX2_9HYPO|nr:Acyltransferase 3 [Purpureocillium lavendulum]